MESETIKALADRFLMWPLPKSVCSDLCVTDRNYAYPRRGTNLLTADEATQMIEHLFDAADFRIAELEVQIARLEEQLSAALSEVERLKGELASKWRTDIPRDGDCRKFVTLQSRNNGMIWTGIRAWNGASWLNNGEIEEAIVLSWQDIPAPSKSDGLMSPMPAPTLPEGML